MKSKFTTIILFFIVIILVLGILILGSAMYIDLIGDGTSNVIHEIQNIATEEPEEKDDINLEISSQNISSSIQGIAGNNSQEAQTMEVDDNSINHYFYKQLVGNQKVIYDGLQNNKQNLKLGNYKIEFGNIFSDILSQENGGEELGKDYQTAIEAFLHDNPDIFYLDVNKMYLNIETTTRFLRTTYNVYISPAQGSTYLSDEFATTAQIDRTIEEIEFIKNDIINQLRGSEYKKILWIHNYLIDNIEYDSSYQAMGSYSIYGALIGKRCVCEGYAKAFKYLVNEAGIECEIMQGTATNSSGQTESHAWNCVNVEGTWYEIDVTWDDPIVVGGGKVVSNQFRYKYFLKGRNTFEKDHVLSYQFSENGKVFGYPSISGSDY